MAAQLKQLNRETRFAVWITQRVGTMPAFYTLVLTYAGWITVNVLLGKHAFDPAPNFLLLLFISNAIQLWWLPLLSVGQNVLNQLQTKTMLRDLQVDSETGEHLVTLQQQVGTLTQRVEFLTTLLQAALPKLDVVSRGDEDP